MLGDYIGFGVRNCVYGGLGTALIAQLSSPEGWTCPAFCEPALDYDLLNSEPIDNILIKCALDMR